MKETTILSQTYSLKSFSKKKGFTRSMMIHSFTPQYGGEEGQLPTTSNMALYAGSILTTLNRTDSVDPCGRTD